MTPEERVRTSDGSKSGLFIVANGLLNDMRIGGLACHDLAYTIRQCIAEAVAEERERMQAELDATREQAKRVVDAALEYRRLVRAEDSMCPSLVELSAGDELDAAIRAAIAKGGANAE